VTSKTETLASYIALHKCLKLDQTLNYMTVKYVRYVVEQIYLTEEDQIHYG